MAPVSLTAYRNIVFSYIIPMYFFPVEPENDIRFFFEKSVIQIVFNFKVIFSLFNTEKLKLEQYTSIHKI